MWCSINYKQWHETVVRQFAKKLQMTCIKLWHGGTMSRRLFSAIYRRVAAACHLQRAACALKLTLCRLIWYSCSSHGTGKTFRLPKWQRCQVAAAALAAATPCGRTLALALEKCEKLKFPNWRLSSACAMLCCVFPLIWSHVNDKSQQRQLVWQFSSSSSSSAVAFKPTDLSPFGSDGACLPWRTAAFLVSLFTTALPHFFAYN